MINNLRERFWAKVQICEHGYDCEDCCWPWTASTVGHMGYGQMYIGTVNGKRIAKGAHVISWRLHNGMQRIPQYMCVLHTCDVPPCCQPAHLFLGTNLENSDDRVRKGRQWKPKGTLHGRAKLTEALVLKIRELFASGAFTQKQLADRFHITATKINHVLNRQGWTHVLDDYQPAIDLLIYQRNNRLSDEDVRAIRFSYLDNEMHYNYSELGRLFGFSARYISDLCQGKYRVDAGGPISYPK